MTNRVVSDAWYVPWNLAVAGVLVLVAVRFDRLGVGPLGLDGRWWRRGVVVGLVVLASIAVLYTVALALPATRDLFDDDRVAGASTWEALFQVLVRIPFGTVVLEEVAFRGVLFGMLLVRVGTWRAVVWSSVLFGAWHVLPAIGIEETNPVLGDLFGGSIGSLLAVVAAVVGAALGGVVFCAYRIVGRHLAAPVIGHVATNSLGYAVAWWYTS